MREPTVEQLFAETLRGDYESDAAWDAVHKLRRIGTREVFDLATQWCSSGDPLKRARGIDVLAQLGKTAEHPENTFPEESYAVVTKVLKNETNVRPLNSAISALGHLDNPAAVPLIAPFHSHDISEIRFSVAFALGCFPNDSLSVKTLLMLVRDSEAEVRDWATFGLGNLGDADSSEIRGTLFQRLSDVDEDVREEAMVGLAKRGDSRVLPRLLCALEQSSMTDRIVEAAYLMLGMDNEREGWKPVDYASALRERFAV